MGGRDIDLMKLFTTTKTLCALFIYVVITTINWKMAQHIYLYMVSLLQWIP